MWLVISYQLESLLSFTSYFTWLTLQALIEKLDCVSVLCSHLWCENQGSERLSNLSKVIQLVSAEALRFLAFQNMIFKKNPRNFSILK